ncbi:hypothetical protein HAX54_045359 [Datura stramonium]|uniref:Uncharacterized protein n=1 Tax=Datura stramonium TaxID=4076 RepID=A0ABS8WHG8_DATST|nr:hypothetical protein [Datura stramonium]
MAALLSNNSIRSIVITLMIYAILLSPLLLWSCDASRTPPELVSSKPPVVCIHCVGCCEPPPPASVLWADELSIEVSSNSPESVRWDAWETIKIQHGQPCLLGLLYLHIQELAAWLSSQIWGLTFYLRSLAVVLPRKG